MLHVKSSYEIYRYLERFDKKWDIGLIPITHMLPMTTNTLNLFGSY